MKKFLLIACILFILGGCATLQTPGTVAGTSFQLIDSLQTPNEEFMNALKACPDMQRTEDFRVKLYSFPCDWDQSLLIMIKKIFRGD